MNTAQIALNAVRWNLSGQEVEAASFAIIDAECPTEKHKLPPDLWRVARRLIHTTGDPNILPQLRFAGDPVTAGLAAMRSCAPLFCDATMIRSGISLSRLQRANPAYTKDHLACHIADPDVIAQASDTGHTRAFCAAEKALPTLAGAIVLIGNAPLALARICRAVIEDGLRPALLIAMPVGFVNVAESKELLTFCSVPYITVEGRRGGSPLAVATLHAILENEGACR